MSLRRPVTEIELPTPVRDDVTQLLFSSRPDEVPLNIQDIFYGGQPTIQDHTATRTRGFFPSETQGNLQSHGAKYEGLQLSTYGDPHPGAFHELAEITDALRELERLQLLVHVPDSALTKTEEADQRIELLDPDRSLSHIGHFGTFRQVAIANKDLIRELDELHHSGEANVYPGGKRPADAAFDDARRFIENLPPLTIRPEISMVVDGEINFSWKTNDVYIDLGFYGDGEGGSYFAEVSSGRKYYCDSFPPDELPKAIARLIAS